MSIRSIVCIAGVAMLIFAADACKKTSDPKPAAVRDTTNYRTYGMGGVRKWHGSHYYRASGVHFPTPINESYAYADTTMALTVIDSETVQFMGTLYRYGMTYLAWNARFFGDAYVNYSYNTGSGIIYFYLQDSIVFWRGDEHGTSDSWELRDRRWTYK